jgi:DNA-binding transcriptional LysR family regulator
MIMDFEQLRCFISMAELGSLSAAARRHFITQPAVSQRLKALESEVGERLLTRRGGQARLTPAGEIFQRRAREALQAVEHGLAEIGQLAGLERGRLALGAIDAAGIYLCACWRFHAAPPSNRGCGSSERPLWRPLGTGCRRHPCCWGCARVASAEPEPLVRAAGGRPPPVPPPAADAYPRGSVTGLIDAELARRGFAPATAMELSHPEAMARLVEAGLGAAILPRRVLMPGTGHVEEVAGFTLARRLGLVMRPGEAHSPALTAFRALLVKAAHSARADRSRAGRV